MESQAERLSRILSHWSDIERLGLDHVILGDMNLCYSKWTSLADPQQQLIDKVKAAQVMSVLEQLVNTTTRTQQVLEVINNSIIDHLYTNCGPRLTAPEIIPVGESDHLGVVVTKITKQVTTRTSTLRLRDYKNIDTAAMLEDINNQDINSLVMAIPELEEAAEVFAREVNFYLSKYAKVKISPVKKATKPFISAETKLLIQQKTQAWQQYKHNKDALAHKRYKELSKLVKNATHHDRNTWLEEDLGKGASVRQAWAKARLLLGSTKTPAPTVVSHGQDTITDPKQIAELFAHHFDQKYKDTRAKCNMTPKINPVNRVKQWLSSVECNPPPFSLKEVPESTVIRHLKKLKKQQNPTK